MTSKFKVLALSAMTAAFLVGCGGGSSSSPATDSTLTPTDTTSERGPIWGATVTDSSNPVQTAVASSSTTNVYTFPDTPKYPIKVTGGYFDKDGDPSTEDDTYSFEGKEFISYSNIISPITNYLGNPADADYKTKLELLKEITGASDEELLEKVPSEATNEIAALANAIYATFNDGDDTNDDFLADYENSDFKTKFDDFVTKIDPTKSVKENAIALETEALSITGEVAQTEEELATLKTKYLGASLPADSDYEEWPIQGPATFAEMKSNYLGTDYSNWFMYSDKLYMFNSDKTLCEKDTEGDDGLRSNYTCSSSVGTWDVISDTMVAYMADGGKFYAKVINGNVWTTSSEDDTSSSDSSTTSDTSSSTSTPAYAVQASDLSNKEIAFGIDSETIGLYSDGNGYLSGSDYNEELTWEIVDGKLKITLLDGTIDTATFSESPAVGLEVTYDVGDGGTETRTIVSISDITE